MRLLTAFTALLSIVTATSVFADDNSLNYNIANVQADATRQVSNDEMHATLFVEKSHKQPAELSAQISQLMNQATAMTIKN